MPLFETYSCTCASSDDGRAYNPSQEMEMPAVSAIIPTRHSPKATWKCRNDSVKFFITTDLETFRKGENRHKTAGGWIKEAIIGNEKESNSSQGHAQSEEIFWQIHRNKCVYSLSLSAPGLRLLSRLLLRPRPPPPPPRPPRCPPDLPLLAGGGRTNA